MLRANDRAFTLVELLVATSISLLISGVFVTLLVSGTDSYQKSGAIGDALSCVSKLGMFSRSDVAVCERIVHAADDSLALDMPGGGQVAYGVRPISGGVQVYRYVRSGGAWVEQPLRPLGSVRDDGSTPATVSVESAGPQLVRIRVRGEGINAQFAASVWRGH